ncbi:hypothetical protein NOCARDAX2BIS_210194 [Nocardioides sp. AX2bis]|nr:hypothetical protein NOCARDAX2BIS_210194 [Nocardioides sp. AX2bis]
MRAATRARPRAVTAAERTQNALWPAGRRTTTAPDQWSGAVEEVRGGWCSALRVGSGGAVQLVGLVHDGHGHLLELVLVLAGVVRAEHELAPRLQGYAKVGLGTAAVATVLGSQGSTGSNCSSHNGLISWSVGAVHNVARERVVPQPFVVNHTVIEPRGW